MEWRGPPNAVIYSFLHGDFPAEASDPRFGDEASVLQDLEGPSPAKPCVAAEHPSPKRDNVLFPQNILRR